MRRAFLLYTAFFFVAVGTHAETMGEWNAALLAAIRPQTPAPLLLVRNLSIVHRSAFDASVLCAKDSPYPCFLTDLESSPVDTDGVPPELAAAYAAYSSALRLFPSAKPLFNRLLEDQTASVDPSIREKARLVGLLCAQAHLESRKDDRLSATITYIPRSEPGQWRRTPPSYRPPELPQGRNVRPFVLQSIDPYLPPGPPGLDSSAWADAWHHIKKIGRQESSVRTDEQSIIARFWSDFSYTITPPGHWNQIAVGIATKRGFTMQEEAHLLAWLNTAMLDAGVVCWEAKYRFNFWRPITAIYEADKDGNDTTAPDLSWNSYLESPPHPEYPSGHSSFSGAAARFLQLYFESDAIAFSATSDSVPGHIRNYESLWYCANEISWSRVYGGIHYLFSGDDGLDSGKRVAEAVYAASK